MFSDSNNPLLIFCIKRPSVSNSQDRNLDSASLSSTQGMELGREQLRYLTASLTNMNDDSSHRVLTTFTNL